MVQTKEIVNLKKQVKRLKAKSVEMSKLRIFQKIQIPTINRQKLSSAQIAVARTRTSNSAGFEVRGSGVKTRSTEFYDLARMVKELSTQKSSS